MVKSLSCLELFSSSPLERLWPPLGFGPTGPASCLTATREPSDLSGLEPGPGTSDDSSCSGRSVPATLIASSKGSQGYEDAEESCPLLETKMKVNTMGGNSILLSPKVE